MRYVGRFISFFLSMATALAPLSSFAQTSPQGLTLQGRLLKPDDTPLEAAAVTFTLQVRSPGIESCILYEETQTLNMTSSDGVFSIAIGPGNRSGANFKDTSTLAQVFSNSSGAINSLSCAPTYTTYTPASGDKRKLRIIFDDGSGSHTFAQDLSVEAVPYALYADSLQGKTPSNFLQVNTSTAALSQANAESVFSSSSAVTELLALMGGASNQYVTSAGGNFTPSANLNFNAKKITNLADPASAQDAATKNYCDTKIGGSTADSTALAALAVGDSGKVLTWDGAKWVAQSGSDSTKLAKSGDTMTGTLTMNNADIALTGTSKVTGQMGVYRASRNGAGSSNIMSLSSDAKTAADEVGLNFTMFNASDAATPYAMIYGGITSSAASSESGYLRFLARQSSGGMTEAMRINANGHVGIGTASPAVSLDVGSRTDAVRLPAGTTAQRPGTPVAGDLRYNSTTAKVEFYQGAAWNNMGIDLGYTPVNKAGDTMTGNLAIIESDSNANVWIQNNSSTASRTPGLYVMNYTGGNGGNPVVQMINSRGDSGTPAALASNDIVGTIGFYGQNSASSTGIAGAISVVAVGAYTGTSTPGDLLFQTTPSGATAASERMRIESGGNVGIGTTTPGAPLDVKGAIRMSGSTSGYTGFQPAAAAGSTVWTLPAADGSAGQLLKTDGAGNLGWVNAGGSGTVTSVTSANADIGVATTTTTPVLTLNSGTGANQIVKLNGSSQLPAVDGSLLTGFTAAQIPNLNASKITAGTLPVARGGTGATSFATYSVIASNGSGDQVAVPGSTSNTLLQWSVTGPTWSTTTFPATTTANQLLYSSATNVVGGLTTTNNGVLVTNGSGVPSIGSSLPSAVQGNITSTGTIASGTWNGTAIGATYGGTGQTSFTVGDLLYASSTTALSKLAASTSGYVLTSNGAGAAPTWQAVASSQWTTTGNDIYYNTGNIGIGTTSPDTKLTVSSNSSTLPALPASNFVAHFANSDGVSTRTMIDAFGTGTIGSMVFRKSNGTAAAPSALLNNDQIGNISVFGYGSTGYTTSHRGYIGFYADENWTDSAQGTYLAFGTSAKGAASAGVERMRIDSNGNVGIGTTSPSYKLDVFQSNASTSGSSNAANIYASANPTGASTAKNTGLNVYSAYESTQNGSGASVRGGNFSADVDVNTTLGNGIGVLVSAQNSSASGTLTWGTGVYGFTDVTGGGTITNAKAGHFEVNRTSGTVTNGYGVYTGTILATNKWSVYASDSTAPSYFAGNVGIGTTSPTSRLHVPWLSGDTAATATFGSSNASNNQIAIDAISYNNSAVRGTISDPGGSYSAIYGVNDGGGNGVGGWSSAGIGVNAASQSGYGLFAGSESGTSGKFQSQAAANTAATLITQQYSTSTADLFQASNAAGTSLVKITSAGKVGIGATGPGEKLEVVGDIKVGTSGTNGCLKNYSGGTITGTCSSDVRLKKDIRPLSNVSDALSKVKPAFYYWRKDEFPERYFGDGEQLGVIAQEVQSALPGLVEQDNEGFLKVKYQDFTMYLLKGFSEQHDRIGHCESDIRQFQRDIASVRAENAQIKSENQELKKLLRAQQRDLDLIKKTLNIR